MGLAVAQLTALAVVLITFQVRQSIQQRQPRPAFRNFTNAPLTHSRISTSMNKLSWQRQQQPHRQLFQRLNSSRQALRQQNSVKAQRLPNLVAAGPQSHRAGRFRIVAKPNVPSRNLLHRVTSNNGLGPPRFLHRTPAALNLPHALVLLQRISGQTNSPFALHLSSSVAQGPAGLSNRRPAVRSGAVTGTRPLATTVVPRFRNLNGFRLAVNNASLPHFWHFDNRTQVRHLATIRRQRLPSLTTAVTAANNTSRLPVQRHLLPSQLTKFQKQQQRPLKTQQPQQQQRAPPELHQLQLMPSQPQQQTSRILTSPNSVQSLPRNNPLAIDQHVAISSSKQRFASDLSQPEFDRESIFAPEAPTVATQFQQPTTFSTPRTTAATHFQPEQTVITSEPGFFQFISGFTPSPQHAINLNTEQFSLDKTMTDKASPSSSPLPVFSSGQLNDLSFEDLSVSSSDPSSDFSNNEIEQGLQQATRAVSAKLVPSSTATPAPFPTEQHSSSTAPDFSRTNPSVLGDAGAPGFLPPNDEVIAQLNSAQNFLAVAESMQLRRRFKGEIQV